MTRYISPLRYPGGKARMAPFLADTFAAQVGRMDIEIWMEPFAGGAGAALALLNADAVGEAWLVEKHPAIAALWRAITGRAEQLASLVAELNPTMDDWYRARRTLAGASRADFDDVQLGLAALIVNRCSRSGIVHPRVGPIGGKRQDGRWTIRSRWCGPKLADRILHVAGFGSRLRVWPGDGVDYIEQLPDSGLDGEVFLFVDPPYLGQGTNLYTNGFTAAEHERLAAALGRCNLPWLCTYDDHPQVAAMYRSQRIVSYLAPNTAGRAHVKREVAVLSDALHLVGEPLLLPRADPVWVRS